MRVRRALVLVGMGSITCGYGLHDDQSIESGVASTTVSTSATTASTSTTTTSNATTSSSTSAGTTATSSTAGETTGCNFVCGEPARPPPCDTFLQDCDEGFKCLPYDSDENNAYDSVICVEVMGDGQHGDPCTAVGFPTETDDCAKGHICWNVNEEGEGTCTAQCFGSLDDPMCAPPMTACIIAAGGQLALCNPTCDPLLQDCGPNETCIHHPMGLGFVCVLDASGGDAPEGTTCEYAGACNPGLFCASPVFFPGPDCAESLGCCTPYCDLTDPNACDGLVVPEAECVPWYEQGEAPEGLEHIGGCGLP